MLNLLGDLWLRSGAHARSSRLARVLALPGAHLHLYGKARRASGPQDGPPDAHRGECAAARRRARPATAAAACLGMRAAW